MKMAAFDESAYRKVICVGLKKERMFQRYTQSDIAKQSSGILTISIIKKIETCRSLPTLYQLQEYCSILELDFSELMQNALEAALF